MPDQELEHTEDLGEPPDGSGPGEAELRDLDLREEIELVADLVVAATASDGRLSLAEIDRILGVRPV